MVLSRSSVVFIRFYVFNANVSCHVVTFCYYPIEPTRPIQVILTTIVECAKETQCLKFLEKIIIPKKILSLKLEILELDGGVAT